MYSTVKNKIAFVCSLLTNKALKWATTIWGTNTSTFTTFQCFLQHFWEVFDHPESGRSVGEELLTIHQGDQSAAEFAVSFRNSSTQTGWLDDTLKFLYR